MTKMKLCVAVPMKPLALAKARLRPGLDDAARQALAANMLQHVLAAVAASRVVEAGGVVSSDPAALARAAEYGFEAIVEKEPTGYNQAAARASAWAQARRCNALLILPADLPYLSPSDIRGMAHLASVYETVVIVAPDVAQTGTNALLLRPPGVISTSFGPHSFSHHCRAARAAGVPCLSYHSYSLARDIDWPSDL